MKSCAGDGPTGGTASSVDGISVYPNPTSNNINIEYEVLVNTITKIDVVSSQNPNIKFEIKGSSLDEVGEKYHFKEIPREFPEGQYILRLQTGENLLFKSFIYKK